MDKTQEEDVNLATQRWLQKQKEMREEEEERRRQAKLQMQQEAAEAAARAAAEEGEEEEEDDGPLDLTTRPSTSPQAEQTEGLDSESQKPLQTPNKEEADDDDAPVTQTAAPDDGDFELDVDF